MQRSNIRNLEIFVLCIENILLDKERRWYKCFFFFSKSQFIIIILKNFYYLDKIKIKTILIEKNKDTKQHIYQYYIVINII